MATPNPLEKAQPGLPPTVSSKTYHIAGILTTVYGINELPPSCDTVSCLWLHHPRLQMREIMSPIGSSCIQDWNTRRKASSSSSSSRKGLIAVAFDQRNHGSREVAALSNQSWKAGNENHAQDMFSVFHGTAVDTSLLMDHLASYVFPEPGAPPIEEHFVLGISLGGHSAWQVAFREPRVSAAVVIIGCPDYMRLMSNRAKNSNLETYTSNKGEDFLGSKDFPAALVVSAEKWDPKGLLFGTGKIRLNPSYEELLRLRKVLDSTIKGKSFLVCSGGADKLVPYHCSAPFLEFLKKAMKGWYSDGNLYVEDNVYDGVGHEFSPQMAEDARRFLCDLLEGKELKCTEKASRI